MSRPLPFVIALVSLLALAANPPAAKVKTALAPPPGSTGNPGTPGSMGSMGTTGETSCGAMLQKTSALPGKMSEVMTAASDMFDAHAKWVGNKDKAAKAEYEEMEKLSKEHRELADRFRRISEDMQKQGNLPNAPHDMKSPQMARVMDTQARLATLEREMAQLMMQHASDTEAMVTKMRQGSGGN